MIRPFRRADAVRVLAAADTAGARPSAGLIRRLRREFDDPAGQPLAAGRAGRRPGLQPRPPRRAPSGRRRTAPVPTPSSGGSAIFGPSSW